jgi:hypothetical protein
MQPLAGARFLIAAFNAATAILASMDRLVAYPTTLRDQASSSPSDSGFQLTVGATPKSPPWLPLTAD